MSQKPSLLHMQLAPTLALLRFKCSLVPRKRGRETKTPSSASGGRLGWGRNRTHVTPDFAPTLALPRKRRRKWKGVRAEEEIR